MIGKFLSSKCQKMNQIAEVDILMAKVSQDE